MDSELAVVVVTYSPGETLDDLLDTLAKATSRGDVRVVLADNGSTDGVPQRAAAERDNVEFLPTGGNLGYGRAANKAVRSLPPEVGGDAVAYCGVGAGDIAAALDELLDDPARRATLAAAAQRRAKEFTWAASAAVHRAVYERAVMLHRRLA